MPEPKNYRSWRDEIARLERGAEDGTFQELWTLPGGQSFRVIGRPHPDGALAFMFEDITAEVSLTRKFRSELDMYQALIDDMPTAMAVFSAEGQLTLVNAAYAAMWEVTPAAVIGVLSVKEATRIWQSRAEPSGIWGELRQFALPQPDRVGWSDEMVLRDGCAYRVDVTPLTGGATAVSFHRCSADLARQIPDAPLIPSGFAPPAQPAHRYLAEPARPYRPATDRKE